MLGTLFRSAEFLDIIKILRRLNRQSAGNPLDICIFRVGLLRDYTRDPRQRRGDDIVQLIV